MKGGEEMNVPRIGGQPMQVDFRQAQQRKCPCGCDTFDKAFKVGFVSKLAAGNRTGQDINVEGAVYVCRACGAELGAADRGSSHSSGSSGV